MTNYYSIEKGTKAYEYLDILFNQDTGGFVSEVTKLIGFEANGHIRINEEKLIIKRSSLEEFKPEWVPKFKRHWGEWVTPKVELKELISSYAELQGKYNMDYEFMCFCIDNRLLGDVKVIYDFNSSGFAYLKSDRKIIKEDFKEITDVEYIKRNLECAIWKKERENE
ncbi:hypothetical protein LS107_001637 [Listeria monocytogenes]|nr:hypothetical protein [Listeria monocytogenes]EIA7945366.1 hypothetical protein [Listeria monocytogenes]EIP5214646.1 hypothetical protein [Listeria monocytogenes]